MKLKMRLLALLLAVVLVVGMVPAADAVAFTQKGKLGITSQPEQETTQIPETEAPETPETETTETVEGSFEMSVTAETLGAEGALTSPVYYIPGHPLSAGTKEVKITKSGATDAMGTYVTNSTVIPSAEVGALTDLVIYARPGMAIGFASGTAWPDGSWVLADSDAGKYKHTNWEWVWDGSVNYAILTGTKAEFTLKVGENTCNVVIRLEPTDPVLMKDAINASSEATKSRYEIKEVDATLYNYDGADFNKYYDGLGNNYFAFSGTVLGVNVTEDLTNISWTTPSGGAVNSGGGVALMGIVEERLANGLPVMSQGQKVDLFSTENVPGKTVYPNVGFEFIYDKDTGYYTYNSELNHAQFNSSTNKIELYKQSLAPLDSSVSTSNNARAGFYPFVDIKDGFVHTHAPNFTLEEKLSLLEAGVDANNRYYGDVAKDLVSTTTVGSTVDMHFAVQIDETFYLPTGRLLNGEEMIYEFTGDDDVWVFIDGQLVLDIGGGHTPVSGSFNLTTGEVYIDKYAQLDTDHGGYYKTYVTEGANLKYISDFLKNLPEDQMHRIQIFYMERHSGESNCRMRFNLPLVPENSVMVSKNLVNEEGGEDFAVTPDTEYTFRIYTASGTTDVVDATEFSAHANKEYTIVGESGIYKTDANGNFTLEDGQTAIFEGIERFWEVYVIEDTPNDGFIYAKSEISVNGAKAVPYNPGTKSETKVVQSTGTMSFTITNYMQTYDLTVDKDLINEQGATVSVDTTYPIHVKINGAAYGDYTITTEKPVVIENIPANMTYEVTEGTLPAAPYGFEYKTPVYSNNASGTLTADTTVTVTNELIALLANLTIVKNGIDPVDYHETNATGNQERQSTIYKITGTTAAGDAIDPIYVTIRGITDADNFVVINELPVGTYTITELTDWSWRYSVSDISTETDKEVTKSDDGVSITIDFTYAGETITYTNNRTVFKWLSGDNWFKNLFNGSTPNPAPNPTPTPADPNA